MIESDDDDDYQVRGSRVHRLTSEQIREIAKRFIAITGFKKRDFKPNKIGGHVIIPLEEYGIHIDPIENDEWCNVARAIVDTRKPMIYMPVKLYEAVARGRPSAIRILLHELGHIILRHQVGTFAFTDDKHMPEEDSEWQADTFADAVTSLLKLDPGGGQLELDF